MIVEHGEDLVPRHVVTQYDARFKAHLASQTDRQWIELTEAVPHLELRLERHPETGEVLAFHHPPDGDRRPIATVPAHGLAPIQTSIGTDLDLPAEKAALCAAIDVWFGQQLALRFPLAAIHEIKARVAWAARNGDERAALALGPEAAARGVTAAELGSAILAQAVQTEAALLALDAERLAAKRDVAAATSGQALAAIRTRFT